MQNSQFYSIFSSCRLTIQSIGIVWAEEMISYECVIGSIINCLRKCLREENCLNELRIKRPIQKRIPKHSTTNSFIHEFNFRSDIFVLYKLLVCNNFEVNDQFIFGINNVVDFRKANRKQFRLFCWATQLKMWNFILWWSSLY